jgi:hypothetical protein
MPLQIFESRYTQLIKNCIRDQSGFGVVRIVQGDEVRKAGDAAMPVTATIGTRVQIADWFSLEHGMLGVVVEGRDCFDVLAQRPAPDGLLMAEVRYRSASSVALDDSDHDTLLSLWQDLRRHPQLQELGYPLLPETDAALLGSLLQVLPMPEADRDALLGAFGRIECHERIKRWLQEQGIV